jgi:hypothetical protein
MFKNFSKFPIDFGSSVSSKEQTDCNGNSWKLMLTNKIPTDPATRGKLEKEVMLDCFSAIATV